MSLLNQGKKGKDQGSKNQKAQAKGSKITPTQSKPAGAAKKVRSTGANRGS